MIINGLVLSFSMVAKIMMMLIRAQFNFMLLATKIIVLKFYFFDF